MTDCTKCIHQNSSLCQDEIYACKNFTLKPIYIKERTIELINENTKNDLYEYLFNTLKKYLDGNSPHNQYDDFRLYYSLDQAKFLKRMIRNNKEIGNWIELKFNAHHFYNLKSILQYTNPSKTITKYGRLINGKYVKDDVWLSFVNFTKVTFKYFYESNRIIDTNSDPSTNLKPKPNKLF